MKMKISLPVTLRAQSLEQKHSIYKQSIHCIHVLFRGKWLFISFQNICRVPQKTSSRQIIQQTRSALDRHVSEASRKSLLFVTQINLKLVKKKLALPFAGLCSRPSGTQATFCQMRVSQRILWNSKTGPSKVLLLSKEKQIWLSFRNKQPS